MHLRLWAGAGLLVAAAAALPRPHRQETPFLTAHQSGDSLFAEIGEVVDWEATARSHFHAFNLANPGEVGLTAIKDRSNEFGAEFEYDAPLPPAWEAGFYYVATATGLIAARPVGLRGTIHYDTDPEGAPDGEPRFWGSLKLIPQEGRSVAGGGFAFRTTTPLPPAELRAAERSLAAFHAGPEPAADDEAAWFARVTAEYLFTAGGAGVRYVFRQMAPDTRCYEGCCEDRARLYRADDLTTPIAELTDKCDV